MNETLIIYLSFLANLIMGFIILKFRREKKVGLIRIDTSDDDGPFLFLELDVDISSLAKQKRVIVDISNENYNAQL